MDRFLVAAYRPGDRPRVWLQPRWAYMHAHPFVMRLDLSQIGIAEDHGHVVGVVHPEEHPAFCFLQAHPGTAVVKEALVDWALHHLGGISQSLGGEVIGIWVPDPDPGLDAILTERGFAATTQREPMAMRALNRRLPSVILPDGYRLHTLAEEDDIPEVNRVLWRGFDHEGPPPEDEIPGRIRMQHSPHFRRDLHAVVEDAAGAYVAYAGIWFDPINRVACVEPVATDPEHRRRGLASAAIVEGLRRARAEGATVAWVGSDLPVYASLGFTVPCHNTLWVKRR